MSVEIVRFEPRTKNTLRGLVDVKIVPWGITLRGVGLHEQNNRRWASLPGKPQLGSDGCQLKDPNTGKPAWAPVVEMDREVRDRFGGAVWEAALADSGVAAMLAQAPAS